MKYTVSGEEQDHFYAISEQIEAENPQKALDEAVEKWREKYFWGVANISVHEGWLSPAILTLEET